MPVFIQNENELRNEDNSPLPANTPSTGSVYDNSHVVECGNQVLELIEKHKKEVQARMANHEHGFRAMLERSRRIEANHGYREPEKERPGGSNKRLLSENSRIIQRYSTAIEKDIKQSHGVRASIGAIVDTSGPGNPIFASSDEYLELPKTGWPEVPTRTSTQATNSPTTNSSPNVEEYNWYEPDQEYDVEVGCKDDDDDDDDDDDNGNNNESVREFATRIRFGFPDGNPSLTGRGLGNDESNEPSAEPSSPSIHPSSNNVPSKSSPSIHPSASSVPSKSEASEKSSKPSSHSPSKKSSKHTKKSAKTAKSQSSHNKNVTGSDDGNSSSDQGVSVSSSYYSSTSSSTVDVWGFLADHFWAILIGIALLVLLAAFLLGAFSSGTGGGSGSSSSSTAGAKGESNTGKVIWHHGPVM